MNRFSLFFRGDQPLRGEVVLFHGITGVPLELEELAQTMAEEGYNVRVPCFSGHGTSPEDLSQVVSSRWLGEAFATLDVALSKNRKVIVGGLSFGAVLALHCAERSALSGLVLLAPSLRLRKLWLEKFLTLLSLLPESVLNCLWISRKSPRQRLNYRRPRMSYDFHSVGAIARLVKLRRQALQRLKLIRCPVLILQDPGDHYLHPDGVERLVEELDDVGADCIWLPGGEHDLSVGPKYEEVRRAICVFLERLE